MGPIQPFEQYVINSQTLNELGLRWLCVKQTVEEIDDIGLAFRTGEQIL